MRRLLRALVEHLERVGADLNADLMSRRVAVIEGKADLHYEDGGAAAILEVGDDDELFVRVQSYFYLSPESDAPLKDRHTILNPLAGKRVRVTVEVVV